MSDMPRPYLHRTDGNVVYLAVLTLGGPCAGLSRACVKWAVDRVDGLLSRLYLVRLAHWSFDDGALALVLAPPARSAGLEEARSRGRAFVDGLRRLYDTGPVRKYEMRRRAPAKARMDFTPEKIGSVDHYLHSLAPHLGRLLLMCARGLVPDEELFWCSVPAVGEGAVPPGPCPTVPAAGLPVRPPDGVAAPGAAACRGGLEPLAHPAGWRIELRRNVMTLLRSQPDSCRRRVGGGACARVLSRAAVYAVQPEALRAFVATPPGELRKTLADFGVRVGGWLARGKVYVTSAGIVGSREYVRGYVGRYLAEYEVNCREYAEAVRDGAVGEFRGRELYPFHVAPPLRDSVDRLAERADLSKAQALDVGRQVAGWLSGMLFANCGRYGLSRPRFGGTWEGANGADGLKLAVLDIWESCGFSSGLARNPATRQVEAMVDVGVKCLLSAAEVVHWAAGGVIDRFVREKVDGGKVAFDGADAEGPGQ